MKHFYLNIVGIFCLLFGLSACDPDAEEASHAYMLQLLEQTAHRSANHENMFANQSRIAYYDSLLQQQADNPNYLYNKAVDLLHNGDSRDAAEIFTQLLTLKEEGKLYGFLSPDMISGLEHQLALAYIRLGEQENCIINHSSASCLFPLQPAGFHELEEGSRKAIEHYSRILENYPDDLQARWLLNIAYMTLGEHPEQVPQQWLIPDSAFHAEQEVKPFQDIASAIGFDIRGLSGGLVVDDFTNDGYLDILISAWGQQDQLRFFVNNADGTFTENTEAAKLKGLYGGLNMLQADYNNDGWLDVFILRGAWLRELGGHPNSLLKNNGDGTFTDVTQAAGLLSFHPTQTATWNDFNRDGWLDIFIGNETSGPESFHKSELYLSQQDGTFINVAETAGVEVNQIGFRPTRHYIKGVTSGDYDNDGWPDLYISTGSLNKGRNFLFRNEGLDAEGTLHFKDVTREAGLDTPMSTFTTWFFDYNNDGWLDIFAASYLRSGGQGSITEDIAAEYLDIPHTAEKGFIFHNKQDGTFSNASAELGLDRIMYSMGANYGDFDNDGWLDFYLGTGNISLSAIMPNKLFRNNEGKAFLDVTAAAGVGHLQKGHAVSFADLDHDGDQDLLMSMGGAFQGDVYQNAFFLNPYEDENHWISLKLEGKQSNHSAIGTKLIFTIEENGQERKIYRWVSSGGSFGASPLRTQVGLGDAEIVKVLEVQWPNSAPQRFEGLAADRFYRITEGSSEAEVLEYKRLQFEQDAGHPHHPIASGTN
jgi:tetratricopeptide (TPR) repeat protein